MSLETGLLDEAAMSRLASVVADGLEPPLIIYLQGDLGAGKTTFTRSVLRQLGYKKRVKSPTYGLLERYTLEQIELVHVDLYRIVQAGELEFLGLEDLYNPQTVFMIEWPERGAAWLRAADLTIRFSHADASRELVFICHNPATGTLYNKLVQYLR